MANNNDGGKPIVSQTLMEVGLGSMYHYNEILKAWGGCGSDKVCRVEKVVHYISSIFGMSQPAKLLKELITKLTNRAWTNLRGHVLLGDESDKYSQGLGLALYGGLEWILAPCWEWVDSATDCLKGGGDCEDDDIVTWITNMKTGYCGRDDEINGLDVEPDVNDDGEVDEPMDYCSAFWNEAPLLMLSTIIWVFYAISLVIGSNQGPPPPIGDQNQGATGATGSGGNEKKESTGGGDDGKDKSGKVGGDDDGSKGKEKGEKGTEGEGGEKSKGGKEKSGKDGGDGDGTKGKESGKGKGKGAEGGKGGKEKSGKDGGDGDGSKGKESGKGGKGKGGKEKSDKSVKDGGDGDGSKGKESGKGTKRKKSKGGEGGKLGKEESVEDGGDDDGSISEEIGEKCKGMECGVCGGKGYYG